MRTTLTLDSDVAALLRRAKKGEGKSLKKIVNEGLRRGLSLMDQSTQMPTAHFTATADLGRCLTGSVDDVAELLAVAEGEDFK